MIGTRRTLLGLVAVGCAAALAVATRAEEPADWKPIGDVFGRAGELAKDGSYKVTILRADVAVKTASGMPVPAGLGLNSYAAFAGTPAKATVVGDTCMLAHEVQPVIDALRAGGVEVVALHNHMIGEQPSIFFLHFQAKGEGVTLAKAVKRAFDQLGKPKPETPARATSEANPIDAKKIAEILGRPDPAVKDGVYKATLPRTDLAVELDGQRLPPGVGLACWAAFAPCPCGKTMVMGDTCVRRDELQGAIDALRKGGISVTGIHNHMLGTSEQILFLHFEGEGSDEALARAVRGAWDALAVSKSK
jgi:hypothetical protein